MAKSLKSSPTWTRPLGRLGSNLVPVSRISRRAREEDLGSPGSLPAGSRTVAGSPGAAAGSLVVAVAGSPVAAAASAASTLGLGSAGTAVSSPEGTEAGTAGTRFESYRIHLADRCCSDPSFESLDRAGCRKIRKSSDRRDLGCVHPEVQQVRAYWGTKLLDWSD